MHIQYNLITLTLKTYYDMLGRKKYTGYLVNNFSQVKTLNQELIRFPQLNSLLRLYDHTHTHHTRQDSSVRVISTSQRPLPLPDKSQQSKEASMLPTAFEPSVPASERPQTHAINRAATCTVYAEVLQSKCYHLLH